MGQGLRLVTGGTDNHLVLVDLSEREITGKDAEIALGQAGITVNKTLFPTKSKPICNQWCSNRHSGFDDKGMGELK